EGEDYNVPIHAAEPPSLAIGKNHATRPETDSFFTLSPANVKLSGVKQSEDGDELILRIFETEGKPATATIQIPEIKNGVARRLNLIEYPLADAEKVTFNNGRLQVALKPHEVVTIGVKTNR
ncbi:MAG: glycosyl hydrolase-related protein, partial [Tannerella sp.]|nr:glycosyl hydrolase-related protein [Tannerella sp.]